MNLTQHLLSFGLALTAVMSAPSAWAQNSLDNILKTKKITIAVPPDFPPYGSMGADFKMQGLDIDVAHYIGSKLGVTVDLIPVTSSNRVRYLETKKADMVIATLGKNPDREKVIDFAAAYSPFFQGVFASRSTKIKSFSELSGKRIAVTRGSVEDQELNKVAPTGTDIQRYDDNLKTVSAFTNGQVDLIATGASVIGSMVSQNPKLNVEFKLLLKESPNYIGVPKGEDKLRLTVNGIIADAQKNGDLDRISMKWLGRPTGNLPQ